MRMGRPKKYNNCLDLDADAELYFESCIYEDNDDYRVLIQRDTPIPFTITGLAMALKMDRETLTNYAKDADFFDTIKRHKQTVENFLEQRLCGNNVAGLIFNLKNNFGWRDTQHVESNQQVTLKNASESEIDAQIDRLTNETCR